VAASSGSPDALTLQIDTAAIALLVNACFGGDPDQPLAPIERPLTGIERETATMVFEAFAKAINGKGDRAFDLRFPLPKPLSGAELKRVVPRDGPGVKVIMAVRTPAAAGEFRVLMPQRFLLENRSEVPADHAAAAIQRAAATTRPGSPVAPTRRSTIIWRMPEGLSDWLMPGPSRNGHSAASQAAFFSPSLPVPPPPLFIVLSSTASIEGRS
jgi:hypothetical protein